MSKHMNMLACGVFAAGLALVVGCSTTSEPTSHQFTPVPVARVGTQELQPVDSRSATELLKAADEAFRKANEAQEKGDQKEALRHYNTMLQLLIQADLDPSVFYSLRSEFERILDSTSETSHLFEQSGIGQYNDDNLANHPPGGDLFSKGFINERVITEIEEIQNLYPKNFQRGLDRSYKYRPYIEEQLTNAGLPKDLVWLAMVESQFHPDVTSRAGAVGMWQFMRATGVRYGLTVNNYVDERRDWQKETQAAIRYLKDLNAMFEGDWPLAIASYNMGEGGISRAIAMNGGERDLWQLIENPPASNHMQDETKKFYPKLLASILVGKNPERYGFQRNQDSPESTVRVPVKGSYSLAMLDRECGLPSGTLKRLNPDLIRGVTPSGGEWPVVIPAEANDRFLVALDKVYKQPQRSTYASAKSHRVRRGETLSEIAAKYDISVRDLMTANHIRSASRVPAGKRLMIPGASDTSEDPQPAESAPSAATAAAPATPAPPAPTVASRTYRVKRGDTLYDIARANDVSLDDLKAWNNLGRSGRIRVGESLVISASGNGGSLPAAPPPGEKQTHTVRPGEFPSKIAEIHGVALDDLLAWNNLDKDSIIRAGDELTLYAPKDDAEGGNVQVASSSMPEKASAQAVSSAVDKASNGSVMKHTVSRGETASTIAVKYGVGLSDFLKWNGLTKDSVLQVGQECIVSAAGSGGQQRAASMSTYTVAPGESAWTIAEKQHMALDDLLAMNGLTKNSTLQAGQELKVSGAPAAAPAPAAPKTHKVAPGESAWTIAQKYGIEVADLLAWNQLSKGDVLRVGQELAVSGKPSSAREEKTSTPKVIRHKTTPGQSPSTIASKYGVSTRDLYKWNNWSRNHILKIGEEVKILQP